MVTTVIGHCPEHSPFKVQGRNAHEHGIGRERPSKFDSSENPIRTNQNVAQYFKLADSFPNGDVQIRKCGRPFYFVF